MSDSVPQIVEYSKQRILTSEQLAQEYGTTVTRIKQNFNANKSRYVLGKHYFLLEGEQLKAFKDLVENSSLVNKHTSSLCLWTFEGCLLQYDALRFASLERLQRVFDYFGKNVDDLMIVRFNREEGMLGAQLVSLLHGVCTVLPQYMVGPYRVDFYIPELNLAVEYDETHHMYQFQQDLQRQHTIEQSLNCHFIRVKPAYDFPLVANEILKKVLQVNMSAKLE